MDATLPAAGARPPITPQLRDSGVVAILRGARPDRLQEVALTLIDSGIACLELTLTTPGAIDAFRRLRPSVGADVALGMGSVITAGQAEAVLEAGADFLVSPGVCAEVARTAARASVPCYPGAWTPTEILAAWDGGRPGGQAVSCRLRRTAPPARHHRPAAAHSARAHRRGRA